MKKALGNSPQIMIWLVGFAIIVFCATGVAVLMGWIPSTLGQSASELELEKKAVAPASTQSGKSQKSIAAAEKRAYKGCPNCGVIESTRVIDAPGESGVVGLVGGAVVGGLLGHQVGGGRGKDIATAAGAVGGAVAGNEIEKRMNSSKRYETTVRFEDNTVQSYVVANPTQWQLGDRVRVVDGVIRLRS